MAGTTVGAAPIKLPRTRLVSGRFAAPVLVVLGVVIANLPALLGLVNVDPLGPVGHLASHAGSGYTPGFWYSDVEIGYTAQALQHLVAMDWIHGILPWWNPYEGAGAPLAAEMQCAAFFPPTLLLLLPQGQLLLHVLLESTAGLGTYFLARELGFARSVSSLAGLLYGLNGTFSIFGHASVEPVAFLPIILLGVERIARRELVDVPGYLLLSLGLALSIVAGFPEVTYVECLFAAVWFVVRLVGRPQPGRVLFTAKVAFGGITGLLLSAPLTLPFLGYLPLAFTASHSAQTLASATTPPGGLPMIGIPWLYGPINAFSPFDPAAINPIIGESGGFATATVVVLAVLGAIRARRDRGMAIVIAVGTLGLLMWSYDFKPVAFVARHFVPGTSSVWFDRYGPVVWELALVLLACYGLEAVLARDKPVKARFALLATAIGLGVPLAALAYAGPAIGHVWDVAHQYHGYLIAALAWAVATVAALTLAIVGIVRDASRQEPDVTKRRFRTRSLLVSVVFGVVAVDAVVAFGVPQLSAPRSETIDAGPVAFLQAHLGNDRFFSTDVFLPDYGAYYGLAQADSNDLPVPKAWATYIGANLAGNTNPTFFGTHAFSPAGPSPGKELLEHLSSYEDIGVHYVVLGATDKLFAGGTGSASGVRLVYEDPLMAIYELPTYRHFFSTDGPSCQLQSSGTDSVTATCPAGTTLVRNELMMPGWTATVNGRPATLATTGGLLEGVSLGAGTSVVDFAYDPPHARLGLGLFGLGIVILVGAPVVSLVLRRRRRGDLDIARISRDSAVPGGDTLSPDSEPPPAPAHDDGKSDEDAPADGDTG